MPPSVVLVVCGVLTETSIGKLFIAGIAPALLTACGLALVIKRIADTTDQAPKGDPFQLPIPFATVAMSSRWSC